MSETPLQEPTALPIVGDAPPSSAGRSSPGPPAPGDQPPAVSDELRARLDKVMYSEVSPSEVTAEAIPPRRRMS